MFNGKNSAQDYSGSYTVSLPANVEATVYATFVKDGSGDNGNDKASIEFADTDIEIMVPTETVIVIEEIPAQLGTGSIGGWEHSELRRYYRETLLPLVPENVRAGIKTVLKSQPAYNTEEKSFTQTTEEDLWIPSYTEMYSSSGSTNQPRYSEAFPDNESRKKSKIGATSASWWWLRSANLNYIFNYVFSSGGNYNASANSTGGLPLGSSSG